MAPSIRIGLAITALTIALLLASDFFFEILPGQHGPLLDARKKFCESIAVQFSSLIESDDQQTIERLMDNLVVRNADVVSLGLRLADGTLLAKSGDHELGWQDAHPSLSTPTHARVPIFNGQDQWGTVEVLFTPLTSTWFKSVISSPLFHLILVTLTFGFIAYTVFMKRMLRYLDPSSVVPGRVKAALDQLVEGVVLLDEQGHMVLVNDAFAELLARPIDQLIGEALSNLDWLSETRQQVVLPWEDNISFGAQKKAIRLVLNTTRNGQRVLSTNVSAILDGKGHQRGVLVSFDDISDLEQKNLELKQTIDQLESAEKKILAQNDELRRLATVDPLTSVFNRRAFFEKFNTEFDLAQREGLQLSCIMADIDHFKNINDNYGHGVGDDVIKGIAAVLQENCTENGAVGRYGGEEFGVVLPGSDINDAVKIADKIRTDFLKWSELNDSPTNGKTITASFGVSNLEFGAEDLDVLLDQADQALYQSKTGGRNRVSAWSDPTQPLAGVN